MIRAVFALLLSVFAQQPPPPQPPQAAQQPSPETKALMDALNDAANSPPDLIRNLEAFLKAYPNAVQRADIENALARAAIDAKDDRRTVTYGRRALQTHPDDMLLLDRVARALLALGGAENAQASLQYSRAFVQNVEKAAPAAGADAARRQEDRDRGESRVLLYQSRAETILGEKKEAERLAAQAYAVYPSEEPAREWGAALAALGETRDAIAHYADAFTIPDPHALDSDRAADRAALAGLYRQLHHSESGMGDEILAAYDRSAALIEARHARLAALDPNYAATDVMQFRLTGLDGSRLALGSLKGSVVVADFWATWCTPCRAQHPLYEQVKKRFEGRSDVIFLSIDTDENHNLVGSFLDQNHWSKTVYFEDGLQRFLQVSNIPTTILFGKDGHVSSRMSGFLPDKFADQLTARIRFALGE